jgi:hypothetical protein
MEQFTSRNSKIVFSLLLGFLFMPALLVAQSGKGGKGGASQDSSAGASSSGKNQSPGQSGDNNQGGSSQGITGGSMAIESTIFAYKSLTADADGIVQTIMPRVRDQIVMIASPSDFSGLVQWRIVVTQADLLHTRAESAIKSIETIKIPPEFSNVPKAVPKLGGGPFIAGPADVATLIQTLASMFAVNQSLSVSTGALTSTPLTNLLAARLQAKGTTVYVPTAYTPNLLQRSNLGDTFIGKKLDLLEADRESAAEVTQKYLQALEDAKTILSAAATSPYATPAAKSVAANFKDFYTYSINAKAAALVSVVAAIDSFEATLLTGQASPAPNQPTSASKGKTDAAAGAQADGPPAGPSQKPVKPLQNPQADAADATSAQNSGSPSPSSNPTGNALQQILLADLLAHQIWNGAETPDPTTLRKLHILIVQTLESGGGQLTKSNLFTGSKIYFSGGTVATFALYGVNGALECGGYAYAYGGYVRDKDFIKALEAKTAPIGFVESNCQK